MNSVLPESEGLEYAGWTPTCFEFASHEVVSGGYGHDCSGVRQGDGQTEVEGVPSHGGCAEGCSGVCPQ